MSDNMTDFDLFDLSEQELETAILKKMEELRKHSHPNVSDTRLRCAAKYALGLVKE